LAAVEKRPISLYPSGISQPRQPFWTEVAAFRITSITTLGCESMTRQNGVRLTSEVGK